MRRGGGRKENGSDRVAKREREREKKWGRKGTKGWEWKRMRGWGSEAMREGKREKKVVSEGGQAKTFPLCTGHTVLR